MRKALLVLLLSIFCLPTKASHYMGGEITWQCLKAGPDNGKYVFIMRLYRDCTGCNGCFGDTTELTTNVPGLQTIDMVRQNIRNISPTCYDSTQSPICDTNFNAPNGTQGAVAEYLYTSAPITITGTPPATGWAFWYTSNARNPVVNTGVTGSFTLRTMMYPYNGQSADVCYDSSPQFLAPPTTTICIGDTVDIDFSGKDEELDSLHYSWDHPLQGVNSSSPFNPPLNPNYTSYANGYSYDAPLPNNKFPSSPSHCANCVGPNLNSTNGIVNYYVDQGNGGFTTLVRVDAYKQKQKVASIYREFQLTISSFCGGNNPPSSSTSPIVVSVTAGDTVSVPVGFSDPEFNFTSMGSVPQELELTVLGTMLGDNAIDQTSGCFYPPCAVISNMTPPFTSTLSLNPNFYWVTSNNHVIDGAPFTIHYFYLTVADDACPIPASKTVEIKVIVNRKYFTSINELNKIDISVYPNPYTTSTKFQLGKQYEYTRLIVTDVNGKEVYTNAYNDISTVMFDKQLPQGVYFYQLQMDNNYASGKLVVQ